MRGSARLLVWLVLFGLSWVGLSLIGLGLAVPGREADSAELSLVETGSAGLNDIDYVETNSAGFGSAAFGPLGSAVLDLCTWLRWR